MHNKINDCDELIHKANEFLSNSLHTYKSLYNMHDKFKRIVWRFNVVLYITLSLPIALKVAGLLNWFSKAPISWINDSIVLFVFAVINLILFKIKTIYTNELCKHDYKGLANEYKFLYNDLEIFMSVETNKFDATKLYDFLYEHNKAKKELDDKITDINIPRWAYTETQAQVNNREHLT